MNMLKLIQFAWEHISSKYLFMTGRELIQVCKLKVDIKKKQISINIDHCNFPTISYQV